MLHYTRCTSHTKHEYLMLTNVAIYHHGVMVVDHLRVLPLLLWDTDTTGVCDVFLLFTPNLSPPRLSISFTCCRLPFFIIISQIFFHIDACSHQCFLMNWTIPFAMSSFYAYKELHRKRFDVVEFISLFSAKIRPIVWVHFSYFLGLSND